MSTDPRLAPLFKKACEALATLPSTFETEHDFYDLRAFNPDDVVRHVDSGTDIALQFILKVNRTYVDCKMYVIARDEDMSAALLWKLANA